MTRDFLKNFGLEKEQIDQICAEHSKDIGEKLNKITELENKLHSTTEKLTAANSSIESLKKNNKDNESLQNEINNYKNQIKELNTKFTESQIKNYALRQFEKAGAIDAELMIHTIDLSKASVDGNGNIIGVSDQIDAVVNDSVRSAFFNKPVQVEAKQEQVKEPTPDRGGYDPIQGTAPTETDFGSIFGTQFSKQSDKAGDPNAFWDNL